MSRVALARQLLSDTGVSIAYSDAVHEGHKVENTDGKVISMFATIARTT